MDDTITIIQRKHKTYVNTRIKKFLLRIADDAGAALVAVSLLLVSTSCFAQTGLLSGTALQLNGSTSGSVTINVPSGLTGNYTLTLPNFGTGFGASEYLCNNNGRLIWTDPTATPATGAVNENVTAEQTTNVNSNYLFDVSYPPGATGPLKGAVFVSEISDMDNGPSMADNCVYAKNTNTAASGVTVIAKKITVAKCRYGGTQIGVQAEAYGFSNNYAMVFNGGNVGIGTSTPAQLLEVNGNIRIGGAHGLNITEGTNTGTKGTATLVGSGTVTVTTPKVTANSRIFLTEGPTISGTPGVLYVSTSTGTSFTINSSSANDPIGCLVDDR